ncbi:MAG TPA: polyhydroxyalkanoic acid system family protein [Rudaea sp.]|nr:polyhydroxyalkanoic acid system family protein [Rudaea sp.]
MASIDICHRHGSTMAKARAAIEKTANSIRQRFAIDSHWEGNVLHFERTGVSGQIQVDRNQVHVQAQLGFLLGAMKPMIEKEIRDQLDKNFA